MDYSQRLILKYNSNIATSNFILLLLNFVLGNQMGIKLRIKQDNKIFKIIHFNTIQCKVNFHLRQFMQI